MKVSKTTGGSWLDKNKLVNGDVIKLVSEATEEEGNFGSQLTANCRVKGWEGGAEKISINNPTKNALIEAFGDDTAQWMNQLLTVSVMETVVGGKSGIALYLVPEGFMRTKDAGGYIVITKTENVKMAPPKSFTPDIGAEEFNEEDVPF